MTYRILVFSEEEENFVIEIMASPSTTFHELHALIMDACEYTETGNHQFLICNEAWKGKEKIHLHSPQSVGMDEDLYMMDEVRLEDFLEEDGQHIAYIYETNSRKSLLIELVENIFSTKTDKVFVSRHKGTPPTQKEEMEEVAASIIPTTADTTESATEENEDGALFSDDELDMEGFEVSEM
mgnify:CR=1 FL=1